MRFKDGVVLKRERGALYSEILTIQCPKCSKMYRLPHSENGLNHINVPKYCPYCGKKLVKRG